MVVIVDYKVGNIGNVARAIKSQGIPVTISDDLKIIANAQCLVLPGQGAFKEAMTQLKKKNLVSVIQAHIKQNKPFLGICVGFQLLFEHSSEDGSHSGLNIFPGKIEKYTDPQFKIPQMGWNKLNVKNDPNTLFTEAQNEHVYFANSYYLKTTDPDIICTSTDYGGPFVSSIQTPSLLATQFHPEKSGPIGLKILENFFKSQNLN